SDLLARLMGRRDGARSTAAATQPFDFDALARDLAAGLSRREALRRLGGGLAVTLLASLNLGRAWGLSNGDCAAFCNSIYPPGPLRGRCTADAAHGTGLCYECGPAAPAGHGPVCGTAINPTNRFCCRADQVCVQNQCACPTGYTECNGQCNP